MLGIQPIHLHNLYLLLLLLRNHCVQKNWHEQSQPQRVQSRPDHVHCFVDQRGVFAWKRHVNVRASDDFALVAYLEEGTSYFVEEGHHAFRDPEVGSYHSRRLRFYQYFGSPIVLVVLCQPEIVDRKSSREVSSVWLPKIDDAIRNLSLQIISPFECSRISLLKPLHKCRPSLVLPYKQRVKPLLRRTVVLQLQIYQFLSDQLRGLISLIIVHLVTREI